MSSKVFHFKKFSIFQDQCQMKVGTDGILLGAWAPVKPHQKALDIGTGTGLIAIMLAQRNLNLSVTGVEIDPEACDQATKNMAASEFKERLQLHRGPIQEFADENRESFDLVVCNPPFFSGGTLSNQYSRSVVRHTIKLPNGDLLKAARLVLNKNGQFCVILPYLEGLRFRELAINYQLYCTKMVEVETIKGKGAERVLLTFEKVASELSIEKMHLFETDGQQRGPQYQQLVGAYYLD